MSNIGHFIQACPTNDDPNYENKVRIKRTTGIPRSFLKTVERPLALDGGGIDGKSLPPGVMVNADGDFVIAEPDAKAWERFQAKQQINTAARKAEEALSKELEEKGLACTIDRKLYNKPTRTPCCGKTFCHDCISNSLMENDFRCPECDQTPVLLDDLIDDPEMEERVMAHKTPENGEGKAASPTSTAAGSPRRSPSANREKAITIKTEPGTGDSLHLAVPGDNARKVTSLPDTTIIRPSSTDSSVSRKRKADSDLDNSRASKAPSPVIEREPSPISEGDERSQKEGALPSTTPAGEDPSQPEVGTDIEKQDGDAASPSNLIKETVASVDRSATSTPLLPRIQDTPALPIATTDITTVPVGGVGMPALGNNANANMNWMTGMTPAMMNQMLAMGSLNNNGTNMNTTTTPAFNPAAMMMMMNGGLANPMLGMGTMGMDLMNPMMMNMGGMGTMGSMGMGMMGMGFGMGMPLGMNGMNTGQQFGGNNQFGTQQQQQQQYQPQQQQQGYNQGGRGNGGYQQQQQQWRGARGNRGRRGGNWRNEQVHH